MIIIAEIDTFGDQFVDVLPWVRNMDLDGLVRALVSDLNGILNLANDVANGRQADYTAISNTMELLLSDYDAPVGQESIYELKKAISALLQAMFDDLSRIVGWPNYRFRLIKYVTGPHISQEYLRLTLDAMEMYQYSDRVCSLMIETATRLLEAFCAWDNR